MTLRNLRRRAVRGDVSGLRGNVSGLYGTVTGLRGDVTGLCGNADACGLTAEDRVSGVDVAALTDDAEAVEDCDQ